MKNRYIAALLALFTGGIGGHAFYLNQKKKAILMLVFCWTFIPVLVGIYDVFVLLLLMPDEDFDVKFNGKQRNFTAGGGKKSDMNQVIKTGLKKGIIKAIFRL